MQKTVGILGGMGPEATAAFFHQLIQLTPAEKDQDHLRIIVFDNPKIPDRTAFLKNEGPSPLPELAKTARELARAGVDLIAIPCNTAHVFWPEIQAAVDVPVLNIIDVTVEQAASSAGDGPVGILATQGTIGAALYQEALIRLGRVPLIPGNARQEDVTHCIHRVKFGGDVKVAAAELERALAELQSKGAGSLIYGCTELGLVPCTSPLPVIDSLKVLAQRTLEAAMGESVRGRSSRLER